jgi:branched-chain amino acid transport system permease protein
VAAVVLSGLFVGLIYGLLAIGLVLTYRVSKVINFAYGETGMLAAFVYLQMRTGVTTEGFSVGTDRGVLFPLLGALGVGAVVGVLLEITVVRPARKSSALNGMVGTVAWSLLLIAIANSIYGPNVHQGKPLWDSPGIQLLGLQLSSSQLLTAACTVVIVTVLFVVYRFTSVGLRLRATAVDPYAASLSAINVNLTSTVTWGLAGALSALSAILISGIQGSFDLFFMTVLALRAFIAALAGGLTSIWGGFAAGVVLGLGEAVIQFKTPVTGITELVVATGILALMVVRRGGVVRAQY